MDCSLPSNVISIAYGTRGGKYDEKDLPKISRQRTAAIDAAISVGLKLRKQNMSMKDRYKAGLEWVTKAGHSNLGPAFAATLTSIIAKVYINKDTNNPVWA